MITLSNKVKVSDPCYSIDTWCSATLENVKPGNYQCEAEYDRDGHVSQITAIHEEYLSSVLNFEKQEAVDIGVDSGQAGIFDFSYYEQGREDSDDKPYNFEEPKTFYDKCCKITLSEEKVGEIENKGYVASSGYGDGSYDLFLAFNTEKQVVAIKVVFLNDDEDEIDEEEYEEEYEED